MPHLWKAGVNESLAGVTLKWYMTKFDMDEYIAKKAMPIGQI